MRKAIQIAIYGKGGIGKSTTTSNLSAALSKMGFNVMQFGCDPKSDSTNTLRKGKKIQTILDTMRIKRNVELSDVVFEGFNGVYCVEAGGPEPGVGCAGRGIIAAINVMKEQNAYEELDLDFVLYDVLGDVVCGGFAVPIREGIADHIFTVSSSDYMSIFAANNLFKGILKFSNKGGGLLGGVIGNSINHSYQQSILDEFVKKTKTQIIDYIPRSIDVTQSELSGITTIELNPDSKQARKYFDLAEKIAKHSKSAVPSPLSSNDMEKLSLKWGKELMNIEN